jgi:membrane-bound metal-dependent hydrolase YbcI (DUF457 family)
MDPVSHLAFGRTLVALDGRRALGAGAIAACMCGSLAPDVDAVFMPVGWDVYLRYHQGGTHSLLGSMACAALTAAIVRFSIERGRYSCLYLAAWIGCAGHLLLDVISGADIRFFWPLGPPVRLPLFAMADPWLGGALVLGLAVLALRRSDRGRAAGAILIAVAILSAAKWALYVRVQERDHVAGRAVTSRRAETEWGSLTRWVAYEAGADTVEAGRVNGVTGAVTPLIHLTRGLGDPLVIRSLQLATVRNFLSVHAVTFAVVIGTAAEGRQVLWSDLRYCGPLETSRRSVPWAPIDLGSGSPLSCALWFGGEFDRAGLPTASVVHIGQLVQRRSIR